MKPILIVNGAKDARLRLIEILSQAGYETVDADTGQRALEIAPNLQPALVFMTIVMPDSNGLETALRLRNLSGFEAVPIILLGCLPPLGIHDEPLASLVNGYLPLDASADELLSCVAVQMQKNVRET
jgi:CheY-like chemotaxis protein